MIQDTGNDALVSIDGTDFRIQEPKKPFNSKWYSKKFNGPGIRYEVGVSINTGYIVWYNGPYPAGMMPDTKIYFRDLRWILDTSEKIIADKGYQGLINVMTPFEAKDEKHKKQMALARARHETVNRRFKQWHCLQERWRHDRNKHQDVFIAIVCLTQIEILNGHPLFQVTYDRKVFDE